MTRPGPKPTPTKLKLLRGETRPSRVNRREPQPRLDVPNPPTWLSREAAAEWRRMVAGEPPGLLTVLDRQVLSVAAEAWARWVEATRAVNALGLLVPGDRGMVKNPAIQIARDAEQTLRQCWAELGLSPAARARLEMPAVDGDELQSLLS